MSEVSQKNGLSLLGLLLALGLIAAAFILGIQFKNFRQPGTITVKGLAEQPFKADSAEWQTGVHVWGDSYQTALAQLKQTRPSLVAFLKQQGFAAAEIKTAAPQIEPYYEESTTENGDRKRVQNGYTADQKLIITSKSLDKIQAAHAAILTLRANNDSIRFEAPQYLLSNLETIKHSLIKQATEDAYKRAQEFAQTSHSKVGALRSASQGSFNILAASTNEESNSDEWGGSYDKTTIDKRVRLVVTIEYGVD